ncbi:MAG: hypothetical protein IJC18_02905 [Clostridia bacterium]|nr:hypothetical protein [Clostridia bacterium]
MRSFYRIFAIIAAAILTISAAAPSVSATLEGPTTTTTTTAAPSGPSISGFHVIGSNNKFYLCSPDLAPGVDKYSFSVPNWMEQITLVIKTAAGTSITSDGTSFKESSGVFTCDFELTKSSQTFSIVMEGSSGKRTLSVTVYRSNIPCSIESVSLIKGGEAVTAKSGSVADGLSYEFASGTTEGISIRVVPRHEEKVLLTKLTGIPEEEWEDITDEEKTQLTLHETYKRYDYTLPLEEGTNLFRLEVKAGEVIRTSDITVIVGDPAANATQPTTTTTATSATDAPTTTVFTVSTTAAGEGGSGGLSSIVWVLIGVVGTVIVGACIYAIVNVSGGGNRQRDYDDYDYNQPPLRSRRRNLTDYIDDSYYEDGGQPMYRDRGGFDNYSDGYSDGYGDNYGYGGRRGGYDDYQQPPRRGGSSGYSDYDDYDDFGGGFRGNY